MNSKALEAFRTIGEVSTMLGVPSHVLRSWEKLFPKVGASKRIGGRRYYSHEDCEKLLFIREKLKEGYSARGVKNLLAARRETRSVDKMSVEEASAGGALGERFGRGKEIFALRRSIEELRKRLILM